MPVKGCLYPEADALYASQLEPWSRFLTGVQGQAPQSLLGSHGIYD